MKVYDFGEKPGFVKAGRRLNPYRRSMSKRALVKTENDVFAALMIRESPLENPSQDHILTTLDSAPSTGAVTHQRMPKPSRIRTTSRSRDGVSPAGLLSGWLCGCFGLSSWSVCVGILILTVRRNVSPLQSHALRKARPREAPRLPRCVIRAQAALSPRLGPAKNDDAASYKHPTAAS